MGIPLVRNNSVDDINTSIIAIKKELGKGGSGDMGDVNVNVDVKYEVTDTVEDGNSLPVTSQGVYDYVEGQVFTPVDEVAINNMKAVTSNAVAKSLSYSTTEQKTGGVWIDGKMIYRRVGVCLTQGSTSSNQNYSALDMSANNVESIIDGRIIEVGSSVARYVFNSCLWRIGNNGALSFWCSGQGWSPAETGNTRYVVVEYTKAD